MVEYRILKCFVEDITLYDKYYSSLNLEFIKQNYPIMNKLFKSLPASSFTELEAKYLTNYPVLKEGDRLVLRENLNTIEASESALEGVLEYLEGHLSRAWASDVALMALDVAEGKQSVEKLNEILAKQSQSTIVTADVELISTSITELTKIDELEPGLNWQLKCLRQSLGAIRKGNLGHIAARIETGKTALWVSEVIYMAQQLPEDENVTIFFNEENSEDVVWRLYSSLTGKPYKEIKNNLTHYEEIWNTKIGKRIKFVPPEYSTKRHIEAIMEAHKPSLVVIDNSDKVLGFDGDREDLRLHAIYKWARQLAQKYCPIISVGQADFSGANQRVITESQLAGGKTGKPSELDFLITIGKIDKDGYEDVRFISTPRNKLRGDATTVDTMRHIKGVDVMLNPLISRYTDM